MAPPQALGTEESVAATTTVNINVNTTTTTSAPIPISTTKSDGNLKKIPLQVQEERVFVQDKTAKPRQQQQQEFHPQRQQRQQSSSPQSSSDISTVEKLASRQGVLTQMASKRKPSLDNFQHQQQQHQRPSSSSLQPLSQPEFLAPAPHISSQPQGGFQFYSFLMDNMNQPQGSYHDQDGEDSHHEVEDSAEMVEEGFDGSDMKPAPQLWPQDQGQGQKQQRQQVLHLHNTSQNIQLSTDLGPFHYPSQESNARSQSSIKSASHFSVQNDELSNKRPHATESKESGQSKARKLQPTATPSGFDPTAAPDRGKDPNNKETNYLFHRKARAKISKNFNILKNLLPNLPANSKAINKNVLLECAVSYIREIRARELKMESDHIFSSRHNVFVWVEEVVKEHDTIESALTPILKMIGVAFGWKYGELWRPNNNEALGHALGVITVSKKETEHSKLEEFGQNSICLQFPRMVGLPGRVWNSGSWEWLTKCNDPSSFIRAAAAVDANIETGFGIPVIVAGSMYGVLTLFDVVKRDVDPLTVEHVSNVVSIVGAHFGAHMV